MIQNDISPEKILELGPIKVYRLILPTLQEINPIWNDVTVDQIWGRKLEKIRALKAVAEIIGRFMKNQELLSEKLEEAKSKL